MESTCIIDGCPNPPCNVRGWCNAHYLRWRKYRDPLHPKKERKPCSVDGCATLAAAHTFCYKHLRRFKLYGSPTKGRPEQVTPGTLRRKLEDEVFTYRGTQCLIWEHGTAKGYGVIRVDGQQRYVHRLACEEINGPPPTPEHQAAHNCGNPLCCNPLHLRWATRLENEADKVIHGTRKPSSARMPPAVNG